MTRAPASPAEMAARATAPTVYVPPPPDYVPPGPSGSFAQSLAAQTPGAMLARITDQAAAAQAAQQAAQAAAQAPAAPLPPAPAPDASLPPAVAPDSGGGYGGGGGDFGGGTDDGSASDDGSDQGPADDDSSYAQEDLDQASGFDGYALDDGGDGNTPDDASASPQGAMDLLAAQMEGSDMTEDDSSGFDSVGCYDSIGEDAGFSIPALWKLMNAMRPMSKAQADKLLAGAEQADQIAVKYLAGSSTASAVTSAKAAQHLEGVQNTRESIANASSDPLSDPDANGVRVMTADAFTNANTFYEGNAAAAANLDALYSDLKSGFAALPGKVVDAIKSAGSAVIDTVSSVGTAVKYIIIGGVVLVVTAAGIFIYKRATA